MDYDEITLDELKEVPLVLRERGSGTVDVLITALHKHNIKQIKKDELNEQRFAYPLLQVGVADKALVKAYSDNFFAAKAKGGFYKLNCLYYFVNQMIIRIFKHTKS